MFRFLHARRMAGSTGRAAASKMAAGSRLWAVRVDARIAENHLPAAPPHVGSEPFLPDAALRTKWRNVRETGIHACRDGPLPTFPSRRNVRHGFRNAGIGPRCSNLRNLVAGMRITPLFVIEACLARSTKITIKEYFTSAQLRYSRHPRSSRGRWYAQLGQVPQMRLRHGALPLRVGSDCLPYMCPRQYRALLTFPR